MASKKRGEHTLADILRIRPKWFIEKFSSDITKTLDYIHTLTEYGFSDLLSQKYLDIFPEWTAIQCDIRDINRMLMQRREHIASTKKKKIGRLVTSMEFFKHQRKADVISRIVINQDGLKHTIRNMQSGIDADKKQRAVYLDDASALYDSARRITGKINTAYAEMEALKGSLSTGSRSLDPNTQAFLKNIHPEYTVAYIDRNGVAFLLRKHRLELKYVGNSTSGMAKTMNSGYPIVVYSLRSNSIWGAWMLSADPKNDRGDATHPHLSGSSICWGNVLNVLERINGTKEGYKSLGLFDTLMTTYCPDNPYISFNDLCGDVDNNGYNTKVKTSHLCDFIDAGDHEDGKKAILKTFAGVLVNEMDDHPINKEILNGLTSGELKGAMRSISNEITSRVTELISDVILWVNKSDSQPYMSYNEVWVSGMWVSWMRDNYPRYREILDISATTFALCDFNTSEVTPLSHISKFIDIWREIKATDTRERNYLRIPLMFRANARETVILKYRDKLEQLWDSTHLLASDVAEFGSPLSTYFENNMCSASIDIVHEYVNGATEEDMIVKRSANLLRLVNLRNKMGDGIAARQIDELIGDFGGTNITGTFRVSCTTAFSGSTDSSYNTCTEIKVTRDKYGIVIERFSLHDTMRSNRPDRTSYRVSHTTGGNLPRLYYGEYYDRAVLNMAVIPQTRIAAAISYMQWAELGGDFGTTESGARASIATDLKVIEESLLLEYGVPNREKLYRKILEDIHEDILSSIKEDNDIPKYVERLYEIAKEDDPREELKAPMLEDELEVEEVDSFYNNDDDDDNDDDDYEYEYEE